MLRLLFLPLQFSLIPGTNLFFGLVRDVSAQKSTSCSPRAAFCSCSTKDRRCLNCGRMEPKECECPCECPAGVGLGLTNETITNAQPVCTRLTVRVNRCYLVGRIFFPERSQRIEQGAKCVHLSFSYKHPCFPHQKQPQRPLGRL